MKNIESENKRSQDDLEIKVNFSLKSMNQNIIALDTKLSKAISHSEENYDLSKSIIEELINKYDAQFEDYDSLI